MGFQLTVSTIYEHESLLTGILCEIIIRLRRYKYQSMIILEDDEPAGSGDPGDDNEQGGELRGCQEACPLG